MFTQAGVIIILFSLQKSKASDASEETLKVLKLIA